MEKIVHVVPVGFEIDRIVKPFEDENGFKANKVYLLSAIEENETPPSFVKEHRKYVDVVSKRLAQLDIRVEVINTNLIDLLEIIRKISNIIYKEQKDGNIVYVNISGAGRLTSVGVTLAGMVHGARVYYVEADEYSDTKEEMDKHGYSICHELRIRFLKNFRIQLPNTTQLLVLVELCKKEKMRTYDIINFLAKARIGGFPLNFFSLSRNEKTAIIMKLNRKVMENLEKLQYIVKEKIGRENEYHSTESGLYVASISGLL